jgi:hypothetical protein
MDNQTSKGAKSSLREHHLQSWRESGQTMSVYCRANDLAISTLSSWARKGLKPKSRFKEVKVRQSTSAPNKTPALFVKIRDELKLTFNSLEDAAKIAKLLKELA